MSRIAALAAVLAVCTAGPAVSCALPPPICEVAGGQIAQLETSNGSTVMFSQYDPDAAGYAPTYVLVNCTRRRAVALGHLKQETDAAYQLHREGLVLMDAEAHSGKRPQLGPLHRQLQRLGLRSKRFTLKKSHCGCDLPNIPPPRANCPY